MAQKQKILLLEDDPKTAEQIITALSEYQVAATDKAENLINDAADLYLIDFDLREKDGLLAFRELKQKTPNCKAIMFSLSNSIPLAVTATKLGIQAFLRKPLEAPALREAVKKALKDSGAINLDLALVPATEWLNGPSSALKELLEGIKTFALNSKDFVVVSEKGICRKTVALLSHRHGPQGERRFVEISLSSFARESSEAHFFLTLQELMKAQDKEAPGTVFIDDIDVVPGSFRESFLAFINSKKTSVRIILGAENANAAPQAEVLLVPPLSARREDIPEILLAYLERYAPGIKYFSPQALEYLMYYAFPGNYSELENLVKAAAISSPGAEALNFKNLPVDLSRFKNTVRSRLFSKDRYDLNAVRAEFEKNWFAIVLEKTNNDCHAAARFLDIPRAAFMERLKGLGLQ